MELTGRAQTGKPRKPRDAKFADRAPVERRVGARSFPRDVTRRARRRKVAVASVIAALAAAGTASAAFQQLPPGDQVNNDAPAGIDPSKSVSLDDPASPVAVNLREWRRTFERQARLPQPLVEELAAVATSAQQVWADARQNDDFRQFEPWLARAVVEAVELASTATFDAVLEFESWAQAESTRSDATRAHVRRLSAR